MREIAEHTSAAFGATCDFEFERNYPPTINSEAEANFAAKVMADIVGAANVLPQEPTMGAEDFSYMLHGQTRRVLLHRQWRRRPPRYRPRRWPLHVAQPKLRLQRRFDSTGRDILGAFG